MELKPNFRKVIMITIKYNNIIIHKCSSETEKLALHFAIYKLGCGF